MKPIFLRLLVIWSWISSLTLILGLGCILGFLMYKGLPAVNLGLIFGDANPVRALLLKERVFDGLLPAVFGTLLLVTTAVTMALPLGIGAGIYLSEYSRGRVKRYLSLFFDILAGIPSIVVGLFGFSLTLFLHHHLSRQIRPSLLISAFSLSFLVLPYLIRSTQTALESLPSSVRMIAPSLGATKLQNLFLLLIPRSFNGIVTGIILSVGRCAEDTAVIMLTGAVASAGIPNSLLDSYEALSFYIYYISSQYMDQQELSKGFGAAVLLLFLSMMLFSMSLLINRLLTNRFRTRI